MELNGINYETYFNNYPDKNGYFGKYGGVYIDDKLKAAMAEISFAGSARNFRADPRPSPILSVFPMLWAARYSSTPSART